MLFKHYLSDLIRKILAIRLVNIDDEFILKNKDISNSKVNKVNSEKVWGHGFYSLKNDENLIYYKGFISNVEVRYFELDNKSYFFSGNHLRDRLSRCYYEQGVDYVPALSKIKTKNNVKILNGTCAYLSNTEPQHYGHFIMFVLPLLSQYNKFCSSPPDYYYLGDIDLKEFHFELLALGGVKKEQIITEPCIANKLVYCSLTRNKYNNKKYWDYESYCYVSGLVKNKKVRSGNKKLYVSRGDVKWRKVENESELLSYLSSEGFECISMDGKTLDEQIRIFSEACCIVAPHGAALTNLLYCNENTKVIEIFPFDYPDVTSYVFATYSKCQYYRLEGEKIDLSNKPCYRNIKVDINELDNILKRINKIND
jgi:capsular polysaccharide biosynthesis protein